MFMHSIKNDIVLGTLKFVPKGNDNQVYGKTIPEEDTNSGSKYKGMEMLSKAASPKDSQTRKLLRLVDGKLDSSIRHVAQVKELVELKQKFFYINESEDDNDDLKSKDEITKSDTDRSIALQNTNDEKEVQDDEWEMYDDVNVRKKDTELADEDKGDEEMTDVAHVNVEKI
nr:hypothetical protein [Tanacetum cinerariifolium]